MPGKYSFRSFQEELRSNYRNRPLPVELSSYLRNHVYPHIIPDFLVDNPKIPLYSRLGLQLTTGYTRICMTDYGPYIEVAGDQIIKEAILQSTGQSRNAEANVASFLLYKSQDSMVIIRYQAKEVAQSPFKQQYFYISVLDVVDGSLLPVVEADDLLQPYSITCQAVNCRGVYNDELRIDSLYNEVRQEYEEICSEKDPLSLLGTYQLVGLDQTQGIVIANVFSDMSVPGQRRKSSQFNPLALVSAIYAMCIDVGSMSDRIIIPHGIGCKTKEEWDIVHRMLSCRLQGLPIMIVRKRKKWKNDSEDPNREATFASETTKGEENLSDTEEKEPLNKTEQMLEGSKTEEDSHADPDVKNQEENWREQLLENISNILQQWDTSALEALLFLIQNSNHDKSERREYDP